MFTAPNNFTGYSEIGYRIQDTTWNIDYFGTVKVYAFREVVPPTENLIQPITGNTTPPKPVTPVKKKNWLWWFLGSALLLLGFIIWLIFGSKEKD